MCNASFQEKMKIAQPRRHISCIMITLLGNSNRRFQFFFNFLSSLCYSFFLFSGIFSLFSSFSFSFYFLFISPALSLYLSRSSFHSFSILDYPTQSVAQTANIQNHFNNRSFPPKIHRSRNEYSINLMNTVCITSIQMPPNAMTINALNPY